MKPGSGSTAVQALLQSSAIDPEIKEKLRQIIQTAEEPFNVAVAKLAAAMDDAKRTLEQHLSGDLLQPAMGLALAEFLMRSIAQNKSPPEAGESSPPGPAVGLRDQPPAEEQLVLALDPPFEAYAEDIDTTNFKCRKCGGAAQQRVLAEKSRGPDGKPAAIRMTLESTYYCGCEYFGSATATVISGDPQTISRPRGKLHIVPTEKGKGLPAATERPLGETVRPFS